VTDTLVADCSEWQPDIDDPVYLRFSQAIIIRAMYGVDHVDRAWYGGARRDDLHKAGVRFLGIYQFVRPDQNVVRQARALLGLIGSLRPGEKIIADWEEGDGVQTALWRGWAEVIRAATGQQPWLYSGLDFAAVHGLAPVDWVADYPAMDLLKPPAIPAGEPGVPHKLWQFSSSYQVPGVSSPCDMSVFRGSVEELAALAYQPAGQPAPAPAAPVKAAPVKVPPAIPADWQARALAALPVLAVGAPAAEAPYVRRAQALCDALGDPCGIDGQFGPATQTAVKAFQANHGLAQDGVVDAQTWDMLATAGKPLPALKQGSRDTREPWMVRRLQGLLNAAGDPVAIDGIFGPATAAAVKAFQDAHGFTENNAGPLTWSVLIAGKAA
jgi:peptidoglycan hydrolase-like protein with peptidoglycan-binding domain/GH25 family lysozyme M1 (1,4-beta-N-acetylmuramidase)